MELGVEAFIIALMFIGAVVGLLQGYPVALTLPGIALIFAIIGTLFGIGDLDGGVTILGSFYNRTFGIMDEVNEVLVAVPLFIFMGVMLERSKVAGELLEVMGRCFGNMAGGLGISMAFVGMLLAASTGIVGATVVTMGLISLPTMLKHRYDPALASGAIAASGTLGQIIPPSIVLVILGDQLSNAYVDARRSVGDWSPEPVSVGDFFAAALFPGLLLVGLYVLYLMVTALRKPEACPPITGQTFPSAQEIFRVLVPPIVLIFAVLGSILTGIATPTEAAAVGAVGTTILAAMRLNQGKSVAAIVAFAAILLMALVKIGDFDTRIVLDKGIGSACENLSLLGTCVMLIGEGALNRFVTLVLVAATLVLLVSLLLCLREVAKDGVLRGVVRASLMTTTMVFAILIGAQLFNVVFRALGGEEIVHALFSFVPGGALGAMIAVMVLMFVLGFFIDFIEIVFIVVPIVAPILFVYDTFPVSSPVWVGIMMAINLQTSFLTPPFGFALFYLRGVAPDSVRTTDIYRGVIPFIGIQIAMLILLWFMPQIATWFPKVVFG